MPQIDLALALYPTEAMKKAVAPLYASLIRISVKSLRWYKQSRFGHALGSLASPWTLSYEDDVLDMRNHFANLNSFAAAAARAELRDLHISSKLQEEERRRNEDRHNREVFKLDAIESKISAAESRLHSLIDLVETKTTELAQMSAGSLTLSSYLDRMSLTLFQAQLKLQYQVSIDVRAQRGAIETVAVNQLLSLPPMQRLPTPGDCLDYCQSMRARSKADFRFDAKRLESWASTEAPAILILRSFGSSAQLLMVDVIKLVQSTDYPVIWALRYEGYSHASVTTVTILRLLVFQALQMNSIVTVQGLFATTSQTLIDASSELDWLQVLNRVVQGLPLLFLIIDTSLLSVATGHDTTAIKDFLGRLRASITGITAKILLSSSGVDYIGTPSLPGDWQMVDVTGRRRDRSAKSRQAYLVTLRKRKAPKR